MTTDIICTIRVCRGRGAYAVSGEVFVFRCEEWEAGKTLRLALALSEERFASVLMVRRSQYFA